MEKILTGKNHTVVFGQNKDELLGRGSFSRVYKGLDIIHKQPVAVKCIDCADLNEKGKHKLQQEIEMCKSLKHKHIVRTLDVFHDEKTDHIYIVLERCDCDLSQYLKNIRGNRPLSEKRVLRYIKQLSQAIQYLQSQNIIHRDLKPQNILLTNDYKTVKLADFGMARSLNEHELAATMCGSPLYMAPEVLLKQEYSQKADLWSLGMIMYELLFGKHPFHKANNHFQLLHRINQSITFNRHIRISCECRELLGHILQRDVDTRIDWQDFYMHPWFDESNSHNQHNKTTAEKPMTFSQEVEQCMYGEFRISLGSTDGEELLSTPNPEHNNSHDENKNKNDKDNNEDDGSYHSCLSLPDDSLSPPHWNRFIVDENYISNSQQQHAQSDPMTYTIVNPTEDMITPSSSLGQSIMTYMTASYDLIRGSVKYFNSL